MEKTHPTNSASPASPAPDAGPPYTSPPRAVQEPDREPQSLIEAQDPLCGLVGGDDRAGVPGQPLDQARTRDPGRACRVELGFSCEGGMGIHLAFRCE